MDYHSIISYHYHTLISYKYTSNYQLYYCYRYLRFATDNSVNTIWYNSLNNTVNRVYFYCDENAISKRARLHSVII